MTTNPETKSSCPPLLFLLAVLLAAGVLVSAAVLGWAYLIGALTAVRLGSAVLPLWLAINALLFISVGWPCAWYHRAAQSRVMAAVQARIQALITRFHNKDFQSRITVVEADSLGELEAAFNAMGDQLAVDLSRMEESNSMRRELVANVSHDLRGPLTSVRGYLDTLVQRGEQITPDQRREFLAIALRNVACLEKLINDLFEIAKLDAKKSLFECEPFSLTELIDGIFCRLRPAAERAGVELTLSIPDGIPLVRGDAKLLDRAIANIIENSILYNRAAGKVRAAFRANADSVSVVISDTGVGIPPADLPHIFERFFRVERHRSRNLGGTGLGLAITKKVFDLHNVQLSVQSELEQGTAFQFELPIG